MKLCAGFLITLNHFVQGLEEIPVPDVMCVQEKVVKAFSCVIIAVSLSSSSSPSSATCRSLSYFSLSTQLLIPLPQRIEMYALECTVFPP